MNEAAAIIVMATLNGAEWISEQIESLQNQSMQDWQLLVSDDGSTDATRDIVLRYANTDQRIELLPMRAGAQGHVANFEYLLSCAQQRNARYIFLCDQDDVWETDKISRFLSDAKDSPSNTLWYSDLQMLFGRKLEKPSYFERMGYPRFVTTGLLLSQNTIPGCAMMLDGQILKLALPFPEGLQNHDWWLALCASAKGGMSCVDKPLIQYRQHRENTIGASISMRNLPKLPKLIARQRRVWESKFTAVRELLGRDVELEGRAETSLQEWLRVFDGAPLHIAARELAVGQFTPISRSLMMLQLTALLSRSQ